MTLRLSSSHGRSAPSSTWRQSLHFPRSSFRWADDPVSSLDRENEVYLPSSLDYFLPALRPLTASQEPIPHPLPLTPSNLSPDGWSYDQHLAVQYPPVEEDEGNPYNAQPDLADGVDPRVFGQGGEDVEGRWEAKAVVVEKTDGVVDIYYWCVAD